MLPLPRSLSHSQSHRNIVLLWCKHVEHYIFPEELELPMVLSCHDFSATLGNTVQGKQGWSVSHGHAYPSRGFDFGGCYIWLVHGEETIGCQRGKGKPCLVLKHSKVYVDIGDKDKG
jgi:hypothetical protein